MADTVSILPIYLGNGLNAYKFTCISDGTGESLVTKIDVSTLKNGSGNPGTKIIVKELAWTIQGFSSVRLFWDYGTDEVIALLTGTGAASWDDLGGLHPVTPTGGTADLVLTSIGAVAGATYDITIIVKVH